MEGSERRLTLCVTCAVWPRAVPTQRIKTQKNAEILWEMRTMFTASGDGFDSRSGIGSR